MTYDSYVVNKRISVNFLSMINFLCFKRKMILCVLYNAVFLIIIIEQIWKISKHFMTIFDLNE